MIALINSEKCDDLGIIYRIMLMFHPERGVRTGEISICGMRCLCVNVCTFRGIRKKIIDSQYKAVIDYINKRGIHRICLGKEIQKEYFLNTAGIILPDKRIIYKLKLPEIISKAAGKAEKVLLYAQTADTDTARLLLFLCRRFRYVYTAFEDKNEWPLSMVSELTGVSPLKWDGKMDIDIAVFYSEPSKEISIPKNSTAIGADLKNVMARRKIIDVEYEYSQDFLESIPNGFSSDDIAAMALYSGMMSGEKIGVKSVKTVIYERNLNIA